MKFEMITTFEIADVTGDGQVTIKDMSIYAKVLENAKKTLTIRFIPDQPQ